MSLVNDPITDEEIQVEDIYKAQNEAFGVLDYPFLINLIHQNNTKRVLDIGTGEGSFIMGLASRTREVSFDAIDLNKNLIEIAEVNNQHLGLNINFHHAIFGDNFHQSDFDLIMARFAVEHIKKLEDIDSFISDTYEKLNPGGWLVIIEYYVDETDIEDPVWKRFRHYEMKFYKRNQAHHRIALRLPKFLRKSNFQKISSIINQVSPSTIGPERFFNLVYEYTNLYNQIDPKIWNSKLTDDIFTWCKERQPNGDPTLFTSYTIGQKI